MTALSVRCVTRAGCEQRSLPVRALVIAGLTGRCAAAVGQAR
jgi:hypothetical protein